MDEQPVHTQPFGISSDSWCTNCSNFCKFLSTKCIIHFCVCLFFIVMCEYLRTTFLRRLRLTLCEHGVGREEHGYKCTRGKRRMASSPLLTLPESRATRQQFNIVLDYDSAAGLRHVPCSYSACLGQSRAPVSNRERAQPGFETTFLAVYD